MDEKTIARFWAKVDKSGPVPKHRPHLGRCWLWAAGVRGDGYGAVALPGHKQMSAHRFSFTLEFGDPGELQVLHKCDVILCVRPSHLFSGTIDDNMADMVQKLRSNHGVDVNTARLTEADVFEVRHRYNSGERAVDLALEFRVHDTTIWRAISGRTWKHLGDGGKSSVAAGG